jgi:hypothetical protein
LPPGDGLLWARSGIQQPVLRSGPVLCADDLLHARPVLPDAVLRGARALLRRARADAELLRSELCRAGDAGLGLLRSGGPCGELLRVRPVVSRWFGSNAAAGPARRHAKH